MTNQSNQHSIIDIVLLIRRHSLKNDRRRKMCVYFNNIHVLSMAFTRHVIGIIVSRLEGL